MSDASLKERGRALEDEFFAKEDQRKLEALRAKLGAADSQEALTEALGFEAPEVIAKLQSLGVTANSLAALRLIPLVSVAWADGEVQKAESDLLLASAAKAGLAPGSPALMLLESWLQRKPAPALLDTWEAYIRALIPAISDEQGVLLKNNILQSVKDIAAASGGVLGFATTSSSESTVIRRVEEAFQK